MKRIAIIGTAGIPARYGGFETLAQHLVDHLGDRYQFTVYCSKFMYDKKEREALRNGPVRLVYIPLSANGKSSILYDMIAMFHALFYADTLLVLGVSGTSFVPFIRLFSRKKIIVNIDGIEWKRAKWNSLARAFLRFSERLAMKYAHACIADNKVIQDYTVERYGKKAILAEYGADHVAPQPFDNNVRHNYPFLHAPYAFTVCRIEPENNIHMILEAFAKAGGKHLVVVGNWNNSAYGKALYAKYSGMETIHLLQPIYEAKTLNMLRSNCHVYIHGHSAGGTNPSLVEAMYLGLPILAFDVNYNRETTHNKAFYYRDAEGLSALLSTLKIQDLMGNRIVMKEIAEANYTWRQIAGKYVFLFESSTRKIREKTRIMVPGHANA